jgi:hypothetical protein
MHYRMLVTISLPDGTTSEKARKAVYSALMNDHSFCGEGGRFGSPLCDWYVIGGRWSGLLAEITLGDAYKNEVRGRFPELAGQWYYPSVIERHAAELDALWQAHGGAGPSPYTRSGYEELGYDDDALLLTDQLYDALLIEHEGASVNRPDYADLNNEELERSFIGRKWLVVVDYHN